MAVLRSCERGRSSCARRDEHQLRRFETTHVYMLSAVSNISTNQAAVFCARINPTERATILDRSFQMREWKDDAKRAIETYIKGMRTLTENRNTLIHGNVVDMAVGRAREPAIISMGRDGRTTVIKSSLPAIRQVADDLYSYSQFGRAIYHLTWPRSSRRSRAKPG